MYWAGVSRYKGSNDASALQETTRAFSKRYQDTAWAKKASVWGMSTCDVHVRRATCHVRTCLRAQGNDSG